MKKGVIVFGANTIGTIALEIFSANGLLVYGFLDENKALHDTLFHDVPVFGDWETREYLDLIKKEECKAFLASDEQALKTQLVKLLKKHTKQNPINAVHEMAYISSYASLGHGNFLGAQTVIHPNALIGNYCNIHPHTLIDSEAKIEDFVHIGSKCSIGEGVKIDKGAFIGAGVTIVAGVEIGSEARVGAGSVVVSSVPKKETVWGNPAKKI